jgi:hypothetical protein
VIRTAVLFGSLVPGICISFSSETGISILPRRVHLTRTKVFGCSEVTPLWPLKTW